MTSRARTVNPDRQQVVPNGVFAMVVFVVAETMFFGGLISAHTIAEASALTTWPPPGQPRLPAEATLINTAALLVSGALLALAHRQFRRGLRFKVKPPLLGAIALGTFFVAFQGYEWVQLIGEGLTMTSSTHGGFFYLIVGAHGLHAFAALVALYFVYRALRSGKLGPGLFGGAAVFWYWVVVMWPILYVKVYW
jgi:heme/copper-type cytochrome/quinol oxidase subunit 3